MEKRFYEGACKEMRVRFPLPAHLGWTDRLGK
jgi:hypothetical protein